MHVVHVVHVSSVCICCSLYYMLLPFVHVVHVLHVASLCDTCGYRIITTVGRENFAEENFANSH